MGRRMRVHVRSALQVLTFETEGQQLQRLEES